MVSFFMFCIATVGLTLIITQGSIFRPFRQFFGDWAEKIQERREQRTLATGKISSRSCVEWFNELINCAQCTGFWAGLFCGLLLVPVREIINDPSPCYKLLLLLCCGFGGSFLAPLGSNLIDWVFYRKMNALRQLEEQDMIAAERRKSGDV